MDQTTAKREFVRRLKRIDPIIEGELEDDDNSEHLDAIGEDLWGCHDVIDVPASVLDAVGHKLGATYHAVVLDRKLTQILDMGHLSPTEEVNALYAVFGKDQAGRQQPGRDRAKFYGWLQQHVSDREADEMIRVWDERG
jgi:hypothetical protein